MARNRWVDRYPAEPWRRLKGFAAFVAVVLWQGASFGFAVGAVYFVTGSTGPVSELGVLVAFALTMGLWIGGALLAGEAIKKRQLVKRLRETEEGAAWLAQQPVK